MSSRDVEFRVPLAPQPDKFEYDVRVRIVSGRTTGQYGIYWGYVATVNFFDEDGVRQAQQYASSMRYDTAEKAKSDGMWAALEFIETRNDGFLEEVRERRTYTRIGDCWHLSISPIPEGEVNYQ